MSEDLTPFHAEHPDVVRCRALSDDELLAELSRQLTLSAAHLHAAAALYLVAEERGMGERIDALRLGILRHVRKIAYGQLLADAVIRFGVDEPLLRRVSGLPLPDQRRLADGERVKLAVREQDGTYTHVLREPLHMTPSERALVFERDRLRPLEAQVVMLQRGRREDAAPPETIGRFRVDPYMGLIVKGVLVSWEDMEAALKHKRQKKTG